jgi:hypothetical protein
MKVIVYYEKKKYICDMKVYFTKEDLEFNMRKVLGHKDNQQYILTDKFGKKINPYHSFYTYNQIEVVLYLMKIPTFNPEEPLYNDNIINDIADISENPQQVRQQLNSLPPNHGNPVKMRESHQENICNILGNFNQLPDLEKEIKKQ